MTPSPVNLTDIPEFVPCPGYHGKLIHTDRMTVAHWQIEAGHDIPDHAHPHEQIVNVISGDFLLVVDGVEHNLSAGDVFVIPGDVPHSGRSRTDCYLIDVWNPPRDDYRQAARQHG